MKGILKDDLKREIWEKKYKGDPVSLVRNMVGAIRGAFPQEDREFFEWHLSEGIWREMEVWFSEGKMIPGGRVLKYFGEKVAGATKNLTPANCFVNPIHEDSLAGINRCDAEISEIYKWGGGVGTNVSGLRPRNSRVNNAAERSSGAASFVRKFDGTTQIVGQDGRRGAHMALLHCQHPDVEEFAEMKVEGGLSSTNISILVNGLFMKALDEGGRIELWWPVKMENPTGAGPVKKVPYPADCYSFPEWDYFQAESDGVVRKKEVWKVVSAKEVWQKISWASWSCGDPGVIFWDRMLEDNPWVHGTNPCGEEPLPAYTPCALAHLNFGRINTKEEVVRGTELLYVFLNGLLWLCLNERLFPLEKQLEETDRFRPIGIGFLGLADYFIQKGAFYGEQKSLVLFENLMQWKKETENELNAAYGKFHGKEKFNCQTGTVAPTGTTSMLLGASSGIEPLYELEFYKQVFGEQVRVSHPIPKGRKQYAITAHQIPPEKRIAIQEVAQRYTDGSISSTVNLPKEAKVVDIEYIYYLAFVRGLKGVTVFRDGCKQGALSKTFDRSSIGRHSVLQGKTIKVPFSPSWYVTVNFWGDKPVEVFVNAGKAGSDMTAWTEATARLISLHLRRGGDVREVLEEMLGIQGKQTLLKDGWVAQSGPDAISKAISLVMVSEDSGVREVCQQCGAESYARIGGCGQCLSCGFTQCE